MADDKYRGAGSDPLSKRIINSIKPFSGEHTSKWLAALSTDSSKDSVEIKGDADPTQEPPRSMAAWVDILFDHFQRYAFDFSRMCNEPDLQVNCTRPALQEPKAAGQEASVTSIGYLSTNQWALVVRGEFFKIQVYIVPVGVMMGFKARHEEFPLYMEMLAAQAARNKINWMLDGQAVSMDQSSAIAKKLFAHLIMVARGEARDTDKFSLTQPVPASAHLNEPSRPSSFGSNDNKMELLKPEWLLEENPPQKPMQSAQSQNYTSAQQPHSQLQTHSPAQQSQSQPVSPLYSNASPHQPQGSLMGQGGQPEDPRMQAPRLGGQPGVQHQPGNPMGQPGMQGGQPSNPMGQPPMQGQPSNPIGQPGMQGRPSYPMGQPGMQGQPSNPMGQPRMQGQPNPMGQPGMQSQPSNSMGQPGMQGQPSNPMGQPGMQGQPSNPIGQQRMQGQPSNPMGQPGMPGQPSNPMGQSAMPGQPNNPMGQQGMHGQPASPVQSGNPSGQHGFPSAASMAPPGYPTPIISSVQPPSASTSNQNPAQAQRLSSVQDLLQQNLVLVLNECNQFAGALDQQLELLTPIGVKAIQDQEMDTASEIMQRAKRLKALLDAVVNFTNEWKDSVK
jgi:hypothetical protein